MIRRICGAVLTAVILAGGGVSAEMTPTAIAIIDTGINNRNGLLEVAKIAEGINYVFPDGEAMDLMGHGTAIASLILGSVDGVIPSGAEDVVLVPLVYYSQYQTGVKLNGGVSAIVQGIYDAIDIYHCQVINLSSGITYDDPDLRMAIDYAESKGVVVVAAVGNNNLTNPDLVFYPAAYDTVVGVGAAQGEAVAEFSQQAGVFVVADGVDLQVAGIKNASQYETVSGSSYAAAYVSALAADLLQTYPQMTSADFRQILAQSAVDIGEEGYDMASGYGLLDVEQAFGVAETILGESWEK